MKCMRSRQHSSVSILFSFFLVTVSVALQASQISKAQEPAQTRAITQFVDTLAPDLVPGSPNRPLSLTRAPEDIRTKLGAAIASGENLWVTSLSVGSRPPQPLYVVSAPGEVRAAIIDSNADGVFAAEERAKFMKLDNGAAEATVRLVNGGPTFSTYPVRVWLNRFVVEALSGAGVQQATPAPPTVPTMVSNDAFAVGEVKIDGKPVKLQLLVNIDSTVNPAATVQYLDCNMDGKFDDDPTSWEMGYDPLSATVFHIESTQRYLSIKSVDARTREVTLVARAASEYQRIELRVGSVLPDFGFRGLDGAQRRLSDFWGKYLILDFWGTWCGPCIREVPFLKRAYETYKSRGLEILGMDKEEPDVTAEDFAKGLEKAKAFVAQNGITWAQAQTESIKALYQTRFQIRAWPTTILLDPKGAIISVNRTQRGEPPLRGEKLLETLAAIFNEK